MIPGGLDEALNDCARRWLTLCLIRHGGRITPAAREAGKNRTQFYRILQRYGVDLKEVRETPVVDEVAK